MEHTVKSQTMSYLLDHKLITKQQHAFVVRHSTISNLLESTRDWSISLNSKKCVDVVYIDYRKAFDSIVHSKLLVKLRCFGFSGKLLDWLTVFISNRSQRVVIENCFSSAISVISGIVQGSVLGPILFILFINDVSSLVESPVNFQLFADDLKLYSDFTLTSNALQLTLNKIYVWSSDWQLTINVSKCSCMRLSSSVAHHLPNYNINGLVLSTSNTTRDLGILVDSPLSYKDHISEITAKANRRVAVLFRGFQCRDLGFLRKAFTTYIRPLVEYGSIVWSPTLKKYIDQIETVQRRFTKRIPSIAGLPYLERLDRLNLQPLELRRLHFDLHYYYRIMNNLTPHDQDNFFTFHQPPRSLRNTAPLLEKPINCNKTTLSSFRYRASNCWNHLNDDIKQCDSILKFRNSILQIDLTSFLYGSCFTNINDFNLCIS
jgi:hypothetical protein